MTREVRPRWHKKRAILAKGRSFSSVLLKIRPPLAEAGSESEKWQNVVHAHLVFIGLRRLELHTDSSQVIEYASFGVGRMRLTTAIYMALAVLGNRGGWECAVMRVLCLRLQRRDTFLDWRMSRKQRHEARLIADAGRGD